MKISRWLSVILPAFRISHKLTYTHVAHTLFSRKRAYTHICTTCTDSDACPDSTLHTQIHTYRSSLLWGTGVCVLLQAQVSGQQEQLTCLILSVMLFLHWQRNTLSVPLTLRGRALSLSLLLNEGICAQHQFMSDLHTWLYIITDDFLVFPTDWTFFITVAAACVSLIFSKPVSGNINVFWIICYCTSKVR